jgi:sugar-phosphatase
MRGSKVVPHGLASPVSVIKYRKMPTFVCSAILFDLDGVLCDSTGAVDREWRDWAQQKGLDGNAIVAIAHGVRAIEVIQRMAPHLDAEAEVRELERREVDHQEGGVCVMPGAAALVGSIPEGRWGVVTSGTRPLATARLRFCGLPVPKILVTADDVTHGKPHPEPYLKGAAAMGLSPAECLVIEDAPAGIEAARAGGMTVIGITSTYAADALAQADAVIGKLGQIQVSSNGAGKLTVVIR